MLTKSFHKTYWRLRNTFIPIIHISYNTENLMWKVDLQSFFAQLKGVWRQKMLMFQSSLFSANIFPTSKTHQVVGKIQFDTIWVWINVSKKSKNPHRTGAKEKAVCGLWIPIKFKKWMKKCKNGPEKTQWLLKKEWRAQVRIYIQVFPTIGLAFYVPDFRGLVSFKPMKNLFLDNRGRKGQRVYFQKWNDDDWFHGKRSIGSFFNVLVSM